MLKVPSIDTYMRCQRLSYLSRLAAVDFDALHAVLQQKGRLGEKLPWVNMIIDDLCALKTALPHKFDELPSPTEAMAPYWNIAREFPHEWKMLVREFRDLAEESEEQRSSKTYSALDGALAQMV